MDANDIRADVLVTGCGIAGAAAALEAADAGLRTVVITKDVRPEESNTLYAQGGIVSFAPDDKPELLKEDILAAGDNVGDPAAVDILVEDGPRLVQETLIELEIARLLDQNGVSHGEIKDLAGLKLYVMAIRDPDNIQLELTAPYS